MSTWTKLKLVGIGLVLLSVLIVIWQNTETVETEFLFFSVSMPRALLVALSFGLGMVTGLLLAVLMAGRRTTGEPAE